MLDEFNGLPIHPLIVHAAVVFVPLLVLGAALYAVAPRLRSRLGWAVTLLAVVAPGATLIAKLSGDRFERRLVERDILTEDSGELVERINDHQSLGNMTLWFTIALGVTSLLLVFMTSRRAPAIPKWGTIVLGVIVIGLAAASGYYLFWTGEYGARAVWDGF